MSSEVCHGFSKYWILKWKEKTKNGIFDFSIRKRIALLHFSAATSSFQAVQKAFVRSDSSSLCACLFCTQHLGVYNRERSMEAWNWSFCFFLCYLHKKDCYITQLLALHCSCIMGDISEAPWTCETGVIQTCCRLAWEDQLFSVFALKSNHETHK